MHFVRQCDEHGSSKQELRGYCWAKFSMPMHRGGGGFRQRLFPRLGNTVARAGHGMDGMGHLRGIPGCINNNNIFVRWW